MGNFYLPPPMHGIVNRGLRQLFLIEEYGEDFWRDAAGQIGGEALMSEHQEYPRV
jgi:hypothetical protein